MDKLVAPFIQMIILRFPNQILVGLFVLVACSNPIRLCAWPIDVLPAGSFHVATSNMDLNIPKVYSMDTHLVGSTGFGDPIYLNSLMKHPGVTLNITITVPQDLELYGRYAGEPLSIVGYLVYPTDDSNQRPDYELPYAKVPNSVFPRMDRPGDTIIPVAGNQKFPLIVCSHGHRSNGIWDLNHLKFLASNGYIALSIFYGDDRISDYSAQYALRPLMTKAFIDYILEHPSYGQMIAPTRIGMTGSSFGGFTSLALLGGKYGGLGNSVTDPRIKAAFITVPWVGDGAEDHPFLSDYSALENVESPVLAVIGEVDQLANPELQLQALQKTSGPTIAFEIQDQGHSFTHDAWMEAQTLEVLFFDANLKGSTTAWQILLGTTYVYGGPNDFKVLQRIPSEEIIP